MKHISAKISGKVQGVFFRYWTKRKADSLNVRGRVKNDSDGSVSIEAEGEEEELRKLCALFEKGPESAKVESVEVEWDEKIRGYEKFEIKH
jgi:acylphosphatase